MFTFKSLRQVHATKYLSDFTSPSGNIKANFRASVIPNQEQWYRSRTILPSTVDIKLYIHIISNPRHLQKAIRYTSGAVVLILQRTQLGDLLKVTNQLPDGVPTWSGRCAESSKHVTQLLISNHRSDKIKVWEPVKRKFQSSAFKKISLELESRNQNRVDG